LRREEWVSIKDRQTPREIVVHRGRVNKIIRRQRLGNFGQSEVTILLTMVHVASKVMTLWFPIIKPGKEVIAKVDGWTNELEDEKQDVRWQVIRFITRGVYSA
jgi:hypothetical protein